MKTKNKLIRALDDMWDYIKENNLQNVLDLYYITDLEVLVAVYNVNTDCSGKIFMSKHISRKYCIASLKTRFKNEKYYWYYGSMRLFGEAYFGRKALETKK